MSDHETTHVARRMVETDLLLGLDQVVRRRGEAVLAAPVERDQSPEVPTEEPVVESVAPETPAPQVDVPPAPAPTGRLELAIDVGLLDGDSPAEKLAALSERHAAACSHCTASTDHMNLVFGEGDPQADLMFVGEAPGANEDRMGRPFVGQAGGKLDEMIGAMGFKREDVYIANVLKSRPLNNRTPLRAEAETCGAWLAAQIAIIRPKAIVALGGPAAKLLLDTEVGITRLRGMWGALEVDGREYPVMPTYHPAFVLRQYTQQVRREVWEDLQQVMARLGASAT